MKIEQLFAFDFLLKTLNNQNDIKTNGLKYRMVFSDNNKIFVADLIDLDDEKNPIELKIDFASDGIVEQSRFSLDKSAYYFMVKNLYSKNYIREWYSTSNVTNYPKLYMNQLIDIVKSVEIPENFVINNPIATNVKFLENEVLLESLLLSNDCKLISLINI